MSDAKLAQVAIKTTAYTTDLYFLIALEARKSKIRVPADLASGEGLLPTVQMTTSLCPHMAFSGQEIPLFIRPLISL